MPSFSTDAALLELRDKLASTRYSDRPRLARELDRLFARKGAGPGIEKAIGQLRQSVEASQAQLARLRELPLTLTFDLNLPAPARRRSCRKFASKQGGARTA